MRHMAAAMTRELTRRSMQERIVHTVTKAV